jgi:hypothetical protein
MVSNTKCVGFEVFTAVVLKSTFFWDILTTRHHIPEEDTLQYEMCFTCIIGVEANVTCAELGTNGSIVIEDLPVLIYECSVQHYFSIHALFQNLRLSLTHYVL